MPDFKRSDRVRSELLAVLNELLLTEIKDPRVGRVSITSVRLSSDLSVARVRFLPFGGGAPGHQVGEGLNAARGYLRRLVGQRMRLKVVPELVFELDKEFDNAIEVTRILGEIRGEE